MLRNIAMAGEYIALDDALAAAGIPRLFVKGLTLAALAYGELGVKTNHDIDILVAVNDLEAAIAVIEDRGFRMIVPEKGRARIAQWHRHSKGSSWRHVDTGRIVDLHTALTDSPRSLTGVGVGSPTQAVVIAGGRSVSTLGTYDLFAYLAVHGASSGWSRLKWIADFVALFATVDTATWHRLHAHADAIGAGRASALAIVLADRMFGLGLDEDLRRLLLRDRAVSPMVDRSLTVMRGRRTIRDVTDTRFGTIPIHRIHFALRREWRYKMDVLRGRIGTRCSERWRSSIGDVPAYAAGSFQRGSISGPGSKSGTAVASFNDDTKIARVTPCLARRNMIFDKHLRSASRATTTVTGRPAAQSRARSLKA